MQSAGLCRAKPKHPLWTNNDGFSSIDIVRMIRRRAQMEPTMLPDFREAALNWRTSCVPWHTGRAGTDMNARASPRTFEDVGCDDRRFRLARASGLCRDRHNLPLSARLGVTFRFGCGGSPMTVYRTAIQGRLAQFVSGIYVSLVGQQQCRHVLVGGNPRQGLSGGAAFHSWRCRQRHGRDRRPGGACPRGSRMRS